MTFNPNSTLKHGVELLISSCHLPSTTLTFWLQKHFALPKIGKFVQNPVLERVRKENEKKTALPREDYLMINSKFCPSLPSCLAYWFSFGSIAHPSIALYPRLISSLSQTHRWEESPGIHHWSCSYYSRAPKKAVARSKWTTFLVFALPFRLLHYFVKIHQVHDHRELTQLADTFFLVVTRQEPQNVKIKRQGRKNNFKEKRLFSYQAAQNTVKET